MTLSRLTCCLLFLAAFSIARAQQPTASAAKETEDQARQSQEDVAVFRLLLNRSLARAHGLLEGGERATLGQVHAQVLPLAEGVHLKGQGVVYTVAMPVTSRSPVEKQKKDAGESSAWERARSELRGDRPAETKARETRERSLADTLVQLLMDNGRHFRTLAPEQRVTIAVTFRSSLECAKCHQERQQMAYAPQFMSPSPSPTVAPANYAAPMLPGMGGVGAPVTQPPVAMVAPTTELKVMPPARVDEGNSEVLLGDLSYRQGKYAEAAQVYHRALAKLQEEKLPRNDATRLKRLLLLVEVANRLAQVEVLQGNQDSATKLLRTARNYTEEAEKLTVQKTKSDARAHVPLPAQLVISATKQQLEAAAANKMTLEEFAKVAQIEYRIFEEKKEKE
jgi:hypothetical protein